MKAIEEVARILNENNDFIIASHVGPDGDSLGGLLALGLFLKQMGKVYCIASSDTKPVIPPQYRFLPQINDIKDSKECFEPKVFVSLECPSIERLGVNAKQAKRAKLFLNIDHHEDNLKYGTLNWLDPDISSTCEMLFQLSKHLPVKINKDIAILLYVGIVTDTGRFQYSNVKPSTFEVAKKLLEFDLDTNAIFKQIYENRSYYSTVLFGEVLAKAKFFPKTGLAYSTINNEDFILNNIDIGETEHFIDSLRAIKGVKIAAIFKEVSPKETKVSLRSTNRYNVAKIAEKFGGGGHAAASGYTSHKPLKDAINDLVKMVNSD